MFDGAGSQIGQPVLECSDDGNQPGGKGPSIARHEGSHRRVSPPVIASEGPGGWAATALIGRWVAGDESAEPELFERLEAELLQTARRVVWGHRIEPRDLIGETYLRLKKARKLPAGFENTGAFVAYAAAIMANILKDLARSAEAAKRPRSCLRIFSESGGDGLDHLPATNCEVDLIDLDRALQRLRDKNALQAKTLELHFYGGMTIPECAEAMGMTTITLRRRLTAARRWIVDQLRPGS
jgi:RNA polymerase sigma-70 factor, ECF subfamily